MNIKRIATTILATIGAKQLLLRTFGKAHKIFYANILGDEYADYLKRSKERANRTARMSLTELAALCDSKGEYRAADYTRQWITWINKVEAWSKRQEQA